MNIPLISTTLNQPYSINETQSTMLNQQNSIDYAYSGYRISLVHREWA
jgi:hypothetical protein